MKGEANSARIDKISDSFPRRQGFYDGIALHGLGLFALSDRVGHCDILDHLSQQISNGVAVFAKALTKGFSETPCEHGLGHRFTPAASPCSHSVETDRW